jgi:hypothetical protein
MDDIIVINREHEDKQEVNNRKQREKKTQQNKRKLQYTMTKSYARI